MCVGVWMIFSGMERTADFSGFFEEAVRKVFFETCPEVLYERVNFHSDDFCIFVDNIKYAKTKINDLTT